MGKFLEVLTQFIYDFDNYIIFLFAAITAVFFVVDILVRKKAERVLHPVGDKHFGVTGDASICPEDAVELQKEKSTVVMFYSLYANFTAIFPLLGILGTVAGLVNVAGSVELMDNLMVALTTTLNGVFWAILFKSLDTFLSGPLDAFLDDVDYVIRKAEKSIEKVEVIEEETSAEEMQNEA